MMDTPVTVVRAQILEDRYGDDALDWENAGETQTVGWFNDTSATEVIDGRDALVSHWHLYLPPSADITGRDRVRIAGVLYEVDGPISTASRPGKGVHHLECHLLLVEG